MSTDLEKLEEKIKQAKGVESSDAPGNIREPDQDQNARAGIQAGMELVGSIAASIAIGIGLDYWLETKPLFFLLMFFVGICAGFYNVYRVTQNMGSAVGFSQLHNEEKKANKSPELNDIETKEEE